jgi:hypothetical protein
MLDAPTALAACCGFDLCHKYILYLYLYLYFSILEFHCRGACTAALILPLFVLPQSYLRSLGYRTLPKH